MQHSFDIYIAEKFGVNVAIFLNNLAFWIKKNQANKKHFYDGRYWTYNSSEALTSLFPYWSTDQLDRLVKKCTSLGLVVIDNFNENPYIRTRWYGLTDKGLELFNMAIPRNHGMDCTESRVSSREIAESYTDNKPDIKPDKREPSRKKRVSLPEDFLPNEKLRVKTVEVAHRVGLKPEELLQKFINLELLREKPKLSTDWNIELYNFLINEKEVKAKASPKKTQSHLNEPRSTVPQVPYEEPGRIKVSDKSVALKNIDEIKNNLARKLSVNDGSRHSTH